MNKYYSGHVVAPIVLDRTNTKTISPSVMEFRSHISETLQITPLDVGSMGGLGASVPMGHIHNPQESNQLRKDLRNSLTKPEVILWSHLQDRQFYGYKFRRQHGLGRYVVDFYCPRLKLAIELDGGQHYTVEGRAYDQERDAFIGSLGIEVLRVPNSELLEDKASVFEYLGKAVERRRSFLDHLPSP